MTILIPSIRATLNYVQQANDSSSSQIENDIPKESLQCYMVDSDSQPPWNSVCKA
jgi:hypothetical protein